MDAKGLAAQAEPVAARIEQSLGSPTLGNKRNPLDELIYVVLSTRTPPESYQAAYRRIRRAFPSWGGLADATVEEIAGAIRAGGLQRKKAAQLQGIAVRLRESFGRVTLAPLRRMSNEEAERFLLSLPGVGIKAARCVLMYSLDREVFPVDTHCLRVTRRLGWIDANRPLSRALADEIQGMIPSGVRKELHVGMIVLGRSTCLPARSDCEKCPILTFCATGAARTMGRSPSVTQLPADPVGDVPPSPLRLKRAAESSAEYRSER